MLRVDQAWGLFQASVAAHDNHAGYYGATEVTGHPDDKWGWAVQLALSIKNIPTGAGDVINISGRLHRRRDPLQLPEPGRSQLLDVRRYGRRRTRASALPALLTRVFGTGGTAIETVKTWGFRGAYTHNWDPYWNTALYGA